MDGFKLKILTPVGVVLEEDGVTAVNLPSSDGEIGILPGHIRYSGLLGKGVLKYTKSSGTQNKVAVTEGFCNFSGDELTILADKSEIVAG